MTCVFHAKNIYTTHLHHCHFLFQFHCNYTLYIVSYGVFIQKRYVSSREHNSDIISRQPDKLRLYRRGFQGWIAGLEFVDMGHLLHHNPLKLSFLPI